MKTLFFEFLLYVYVNFIKEDWDILTKWGKICYYLPWFIRSILVWLIGPIFIVPFFIQRSDIWKHFILSIDKYRKIMEMNNRNV